MNVAIAQLITLVVFMFEWKRKKDPIQYLLAATEVDQTSAIAIVYVSMSMVSRRRRERGQQHIM